MPTVDPTTEDDSQILHDTLEELVRALDVEEVMVLVTGPDISWAIAVPDRRVGAVDASPGSLDVATRLALDIQTPRADCFAIGHSPKARLVVACRRESPPDLRPWAATLRLLRVAVRAVHAARRQDLAETEFRVLMAAAPDPIFITDRDLRIIDVNARASEVLGRPMETLRTTRIDDLVLPDDLEATPLRRTELQAGSPTYTVRRFLRPDGSVRVLEVSAARIDEQRMLGIARDATARLEADDRIRRSEATFRALIEQTPDAVLVHRAGEIVYCNRSILDLLRLEDASQLVGRSVLSIVHPDDQDTVRRRMAQGGTLPFVEERVVREDGVVLHLEVAALEVTFEQLPAVVVVGRDLTARKKLEARVALADRMATIGQLAAGVTHEINNPLTYLLLHLDAVQARLEGARDGRQPLDLDTALAGVNACREGGRRLSAIVRDLRTFGRSDESSTLLDLRHPIEAAVRLASHQIRSRARLEVALGEAVLVRGREGRLCQLFLNLLVNAAQAFDGVPEDRQVEPTIWLRAFAATVEEVVVRVADNGSGMPSMVAARVFEPFFTTKTSSAGCGLGLSICQDIASEHGGRIALTTNEGVGSHFDVVLPTATSRAVPDALIGAGATRS